MIATRRLLIITAVVLAGCGRVPVTTPFDGLTAGDGFKALDINADGRLSKAEAAMPGFAFDEADTDRDGALSYFEWNARRDNADTAMRIQLQRESIRDTADGLRAGTALPTHRGANGVR